MRILLAIICCLVLATSALAKDCDVQSQRDCTNLTTLTQDQLANNVFFKAGGFVLSRAARDQLDGLAAQLASVSVGQVCVRLVGHADSVGNATVNLRLSVSRAASVADYLSRKNVHIREISGVGSASPLIGFPSTAVENRRVAIEARFCG